VAAGAQTAPQPSTQWRGTSLKLGQLLGLQEGNNWCFPPVHLCPCGTHLAGVASQVVCAGGSVLAGVGGALVHLLLAVAAGVAGLAAAEVSVAGVHAEPRIPAEMCYVDTCRGEQSETLGPR